MCAILSATGMSDALPLYSGTRMKLEIGYNHPFEIRKETLRASCRDSFSVLYLSDLHLNKHSAPLIAKITTAVTKLNPTLVLLGGDYVDTKAGIVYFDQLLQSLSTRAHVYAIAGNHDYRYGIDEITAICSRHNVAWLENDFQHVTIGKTRIRLDGNCIRPKGECDFSILVLHKPLDADRFADCYDLALAGHLHGSQFVFWTHGNAMYPGRIFYRWNMLKSPFAGGVYFISKGLGDTLPIRYNCKRDMLYITLQTGYAVHYN
jgi:uncharacterized protein